MTKKSNENNWIQLYDLFAFKLCETFKKKQKKFLKVQQIRFHVGLKIIFITLTLPKSSWKQKKQQNATKLELAMHVLQ